MTQEPGLAQRPRWHRHLAIGSALALGSWVAEGLVHLLFIEDAQLSTLLWPGDAHELWMRGLVAALLLGFTVHVVREVRALEGLRSEAVRLHRELDLALTHALAGFIPVCSGCKSIRDEDGDWESMESYLTGRTEAEFTHGLCPACRARLYPGVPPAGRAGSDGPERGVGNHFPEGRGS